MTRPDLENNLASYNSETLAQACDLIEEIRDRGLLEVSLDPAVDSALEDISEFLDYLVNNEEEGETQ